MIQLAAGASRYLNLRHDRLFPVLYIGQSHYAPENRFYEHMCAPRRYSNIVRRNGVRLRYDLFDHLPRIRRKADAEAEEQAHAHRLARLGFHAYFDGNLIRPNTVSPDDETDLFRGIEYVRRAEPWIDQGIFSVVAGCRHQIKEHGRLNAKATEGILRGKRPADFEADAIFPAEGQFAYLREGVLEERVRELIAMDILSDENGDGLEFATNSWEGKPGILDGAGKGGR